MAGGDPSRSRGGCRPAQLFPQLGEDLANSEKGRPAKRSTGEGKDATYVSWGNLHNSLVIGQCYSGDVKHRFHQGYSKSFNKDRCVKTWQKWRLPRESAITQMRWYGLDYSCRAEMVWFWSLARRLVWFGNRGRCKRLRDFDSIKIVFEKLVRRWYDLDPSWDAVF